MRGRILKRGAGYSYVVDLPPDPLTGKRRQQMKGGFRTKRECEAALHEVVSALRRGELVEPSRRTLGSFLRNEWLPAVQPPSLRLSTWATYRTHFDAYVIPHIGEVELQRLTPAMLGTLYRKLQEEGRCRPPFGGLELSTIKHTHAALHRALKDAVRWGYVVRNVADLVDSPKPKHTEMKYWSPDQLRTFLRMVRDDRLSGMWVLFATTGMRRGEVAGLRWVDVELEGGRLWVRLARVAVDRVVVLSEPKTDRGRRRVSLDKVTIAALVGWQQRQAAEREFVGARYVESGFVFTMPDGSAISPHLLTDWFEAWCRRADLPRIRLHDYADVRVMPTCRHPCRSAGVGSPKLSA